MTPEVVDGETLARGYVLQEFLWQRCRIYRPDRPLADGDPTGAEWELAVDRCPFYHAPQRGFDDANPLGRQDLVLVFTAERLYFPHGAELSQDYWVEDITEKNVDGSPFKDFKRYFSCRGIPSWYAALPGIDEPYQLVIATMEKYAPPALALLVHSLDEPSSLYYNVSTSAGSMAAIL